MLFRDKQRHDWKEVEKSGLDKRNFYNWLKNPNKLERLLDADPEGSGYYRITEDGVDQYDRLKMLSTLGNVVPNPRVEMTSSARNLAIMVTIPSHGMPDFREVSDRLHRKIVELKETDVLAELISNMLREYAMEQPQPRTERAHYRRLKVVKEVKQ
jgi:hypothetical protein